MTTRARIYVIYGQGGFLTSMGMSQLAQRIAKMFPTSYITTHNWKYPSLISNDIKALPTLIYKKIIVIGYSLGANSVTIVGQNHIIDLAICYDPSVLGAVVQPNSNIKRLLLYHNVDREPEGHLIFTGPQVERTDVSLWHLGVCYNEALHQKTLAAIASLIGTSA